MHRSCLCCRFTLSLLFRVRDTASSQETCQLVDKAVSDHIAPLCAAVDFALQQPAVFPMLELVRKAQDSIGSKVIQEEFSTLDEDMYGILVMHARGIVEGTVQTDDAAQQRTEHNMAR